jgi:hypothetical protein
MMAKARRKSPRTVMRYVKPGDAAVAEVTSLLGPPGAAAELGPRLLVGLPAECLLRSSATGKPGGPSPLDGPGVWKARPWPAALRLAVSGFRSGQDAD